MKRLKWVSVAILLIAVGVFIDYNRKVIENRDTLGPVIEMDEERIFISINDKEDMLLKGIRATDSKDGDVTDSLVVESMSGFVEGTTRYVNYAAFDKDNHVSKASRKLTYTDYTPIRFSLDAPMRFPASNGTQDILGGVHAVDCLDADISDRINFTQDSSINLANTSDYPVQVQVSNSAGDTATLPLTVTIYDPAKENAAPKIELTDYLIYVKKGKRLDPLSYLKSVSYRGTVYGFAQDQGTFCVDTSNMSKDEKQVFLQEQEENPTVGYDRIRVLDKTDRNTPGAYEIQYVLDDDDSNRGMVNLVVVVEEE